MNPSVALLEFTCGIANSLDTYSSYLTPNQLNDSFSMISGKFVGLGVELNSDRESLIITRVISGSPAKEAGLLDGDRIIAIDGVPTKGQDTNLAADRLQGEANSVVTLVAQTPGKAPRELKVTRRMIEVASVEDVHLLEPGIGYLRLTCFQTKTCEEMRKALWTLHRQGMRTLVLDMRHNPGGSLPAGVDVANLFIDSGVLLRTRTRSGETERPYAATAEGTWKMDLIVLVDEESASASEIVAGALRDHHRATLVGKRTFGKGTIQAIISLTRKNPNAGGLRLTTEKFYSPNGLPFSEVGVTPHVEVDTGEKVVVARPLNGRIPAATRSITSSPDDPFIRKALSVAKDWTLAN
jgi:carboxyl-terminal processing protease